MTILEKILNNKQREVALAKEQIPVTTLENTTLFFSDRISLRKVLLQRAHPGIIAEIKRKSPSRGMINSAVDVPEIARGYERAGAAAVSILTDLDFFGGSAEDLKAARSRIKCPILRKDFMIDEYQFIEARSMGADVVLLIAAALEERQISQFVRCAHELGLEVLLEVHNAGELERNIDSGADMIGVNNRDLKTFEVSLDVSKQLSAAIPPGIVKISESGIGSTEAIHELHNLGYRGFLMGENFMKTDDPAKAAELFIDELIAGKQ